ncbi:MAG: hypothetical protein B7Z80_11120 [Rhodospirillales bacterium 20-64-7]|nr:MAG: hypothetical protein B7Z80_11120 [Rhodospirillales bacterium 20-64-7]
MKVETLTQSDPAIISLQSIFARLGTECANLGELAERLQSVLAPALLRLADDVECHRNVQSLDLFAQRLAGVASILMSLQAQVPPVWSADVEAALRDVTLSELADRLRGEPTIQPYDAGALELF